jgi:resuscitation-promoting factor RpfB
MNGYPIPRWLYGLGFLVLVALGLGLANIAFVNRSVTIHDGTETVVVQTQANTVAGALHSAGISLYPEDQTQPTPDTQLNADMPITILRAVSVEVTEGGVSSTIRTQQQTIAAILAEAGKTVAKGDAVYVDGSQVANDALKASAPIPHSILIQRLNAATIIDGSSSQTINSAALTVGEALTQAGLNLFVADGVEPSLTTLLTPNLTITISRSLPVTLQVDGRALQTRTHHHTVADVLADVGVALVGDDYTTPPLSDPPPADGSPIQIVRVIEQFVTETKPLRYESQTQALPDAELDTTQVIQAGAYGTTATRIRVRIENGQEVSRTSEDTWTAIAPKPQIIGYGTQIVLHTLDTADGPVEYWRAIRMYATSYSAARSGTPKTAPWYGHTRSGKILSIGMAAVDLGLMPLGTRMYVPNYGFVIAEDTGGGVRGKMIDLGYDDNNFVNWHQYTVVYFLTPVPPVGQIQWVIP